jgi:DNA-binding response OmpR family regulator
MVRILCVEDNPEFASQLTDLLKAECYTVDVATDGQAGWELCELIQYDLILLDLMLPKLNGIQLCQQLRDRGNSAPIIMLTARGTSTEKVMGLDAGADDYLVKPIGLRELTARIRALLRRGHTHLAPTILEWGDFRLDPSTHEVTYGDQSIQPSPKEYALLELFLRNSQQTFSRSLILDRLWSLDADIPGEDTVKCHIKGLRNRLKSVGAGDLIETLYGLGYRLNPRFPKHRPSDQLVSVLQSSVSEASPIVLLVSTDREADALCQSAIAQGIQMIVSSSEALYAKLQEFCPQVLMIDLDHLSIAALAHLRPSTSMPIIAWASEAHSLDDRLAISQLNAVSWLPKTTALTQTLTLIHHIVRSQMQRKILWFDDTSLTADLLIEFSNQSSYKIQFLKHLHQFWTTLPIFQPDLIVLSSIAETCAALCQTLRNDLVWRGIPVIGLSAADLTSIAGIDDHLQLPITPTALIDRVEYHLSRAPR